ncbi:MAG TPA: hypothetical protein VK869_07615 [Rubrobacteraceae bacterium]|nr:hypothetical protein [Rubrobacteraceae bacterium]
MSDKAQKRLLSVLVLLMFLALDRQIAKVVDEQVPERRGARDDVMEAVLQGLARTVAVIVASALVRQLARQWR